MYISGGQMYGGKVDGMYKYTYNADNIRAAGEPENKFLEVGKQISKISFSKPDKYVWVFGVSEWSRKYYKQEIEQPEEYQDKEAINTLSKYLKEPYYYKIMSNDEDKRYDEKNNMNNDGLSDYPLFSEQTHSELDLQKLEKAEFYINELFTNTKIGKAPVKLLGYIVGSQYNIYFFYLTPQNKPDIIIYNQYHSLWKRVKYTGTLSEPRQLWFRAGDKK
jgi:hypothetical protein